jgi:hypothetical protein
VVDLMRHLSNRQVGQTVSELWSALRPLGRPIDDLFDDGLGTLDGL